jgi:hypothetical protein
LVYNFRHVAPSGGTFRVGSGFQTNDFTEEGEPKIGTTSYNCADAVAESEAEWNAYEPTANSLGKVFVTAGNGAASDGSDPPSYYPAFVLYAGSGRGVFDLSWLTGGRLTLLSRHAGWYGVASAYGNRTPYFLTFAPGQNAHTQNNPSSLERWLVVNDEMPLSGATWQTRLYGNITAFEMPAPCPVIDSYVEENGSLENPSSYGWTVDRLAVGMDRSIDEDGEGEGWTHYP